MKLFGIIKNHFRDKYDYYVAVLITLILFVLGFTCFPNAIGRFVESCRDLGLSLAYAFCELFEIETDIRPTVNDLPNFDFLNLKNLFADKTPSGPSAPVPSTWEQFKANWCLYWETFVTGSNFGKYLVLVVSILNVAFWVVMLYLPLRLAWKKIYKRLYLRSQKEEKAEKPSKPLCVLLWLDWRVYSLIRRFIVGFIDWTRERRDLLRFWLLVVLLYTNVLTIAIEFVAYYFYFAGSQNLFTFYTQIYKLFLDLSPVFSFVPWWAWIVIAIVALSKLSRKQGYKRLEHDECKNRGLINELGIVSYAYTEMGGGKTWLLTDFALSMEVQHRDDALEIILECDCCFPNFPWLSFERELKQAFENHSIYDKWSCIRWMDDRRAEFEKTPCTENIFGYDIDKYPLEYDNKLYVENIWETLTDYACAYLIYTIQSSLIISNYSIRVDGLFEDLGFFPLWNHDFFRRDSRLMEAYSRHSHILDFDMLRLGKKMLEENPNRNTFGFGVWVITEADKEFKNTLELQEVKGGEEDCNQKNDLTHVLFKMSRHACMIRHRNFVRIIADMQRIENITANLREIGNAILITERGEAKANLPWYAPFKYVHPFAMYFKQVCDTVYLNSRFYGTDNKALPSVCEFIRSKIGCWNEGTLNTYGTHDLKVEIQSGRMTGDIRKKKYYLSRKKGLSKRFASDCLSAEFSSRALDNFVGLDDMAEYADFMATQDELLYQNSHHQNELIRLQGLDLDMAKTKRETDIKAVDKLLSSTVEGLMAMQNGKIKVSEETSKATQLLVRELCNVVTDWADGSEEQSQEEVSG